MEDKTHKHTLYTKERSKRRKKRNYTPRNERRTGLEYVKVKKRRMSGASTLAPQYALLRVV